MDAEGIVSSVKDLFGKVRRRGKRAAADSRDCGMA